MEIVEDDDDRLRLGEPLEQVANGAVPAIALVADRRAGAVAVAQRGKDRAELLAVLVGGELDLAGVGGQVGVECLGDDPERQITLELGRLAMEDDVPALLASAAKLGQQTCLADPRLAFDCQARGRSGVDGVEGRVQADELSLPPYEHIPHSGHRPSINPPGTSAV